MSSEGAPGHVSGGGGRRGGKALAASIRVIHFQQFQILLVLIGIALIFLVLAPNTFPQWANIKQVLQNMSILAVLSIGMTFVIMTAGIDLSVGSVLVFSGVVSAMTMRAMGGEGWGAAAVGFVVSIAGGTAWGIFNGVMVAKFKVPPFIVTLGCFGMSLGLALVITGGLDIHEVPVVLSSAIGYGTIPGTTIPILVLIATILLVIFGLVLHKTRFGLYVAAIGSSEEAARRVGVGVDRQLIFVYSISGGMAGLAGFLSLSQFATTAMSGQQQTSLYVISAVVIGGTSLFGGVGSMAGTAIGLGIPAVLQNGFVIVGVQPFWQQVAVGAVLIAAVYTDQRRRYAASRRHAGKDDDLISDDDVVKRPRRARAVVGKGANVDD